MNGANARAGAWALILGAVAYIGLMAVHPSHGGGPPVIGALTLSAIVHGVAFVAKPVLVYGFWQLTRTMGDHPLAWIALCFYGLAATVMMLAGTMSALVIPSIIEAGHVHGGGGHGPPIDPETLRQTLQGQVNYTVILNRSFAAVHVSMFAVAMVLWSIAWPSRALLALLARIVGLIVGVGVIAWALSGTMTLEAQRGALLVTLVQMSWTILAAVALLMTRIKE